MKRLSTIAIAMSVLGMLQPTTASAQFDENGNLGEKEYVTKAGRMDRSKMNIGVYHLRP